MTNKYVKRLEESLKQLPYSEGKQYRRTGTYVKAPYGK